MRLLKRSLCGVVFIFGLAKAPGVYAQHFTDMALPMGVSHSMNSSDGFGAGVSFFDVDGDGWDDLTFVDEDQPLALYLNTGDGFHYVEGMPVTVGSVRQAIWVDYDNDGDNDLFVSSSSAQAPLRLYRNDGDLTFTDVTMVSGLATVNPGNYGLAFADYNRDGFLDFYLARYNAFGIPIDPLLHNALYRNNGNGTFTNVYAGSGAQEDLAPSFMGAWVDYDADGWPDLIVINDKPAWNNNAFRNTGGSFVRVTEEINMQMHDDDPMSATFADFDNDGDLDFYSTNTGHPSTRARLMVNQNGVTFADEAPERGVDLPAWSWGASFFDAENDGFLDLFTATGYTAGHWEPEIASVLYHNNGDHTFDALGASHFTGSLVAASYGVAIGDANNDGYADVAVLNAEGYNSNLWVSEAGQNNFVKITLEGTVSNRMAVGAWIHLYSEGDHFVHYTRCGENYCGQNSQHHIFGLGQRETIDSLKVWYPSGHEDQYFNLPINTHHQLTEGETLPNGLTSTTTAICGNESAVLTPEYSGDVLWSTGATAPIITVSESGNYSYQYTTDLGIQIKSDTVTIVAELSPQLNILLVHPECANGNDGQLNLQANPSIQTFEVFINGAEGGPANGGLAPGNYAIELMSQFGCVYTYSAELVAPPAIEALLTVGEIGCFGETVEATAFAFGGVPPYTFEWSTGSSSLIPAGNHSLTISDANGCAQAFEFNMASPDEIAIEAVETLGFLHISASGGAPPYSVSGTTPEGVDFEGTSVELGEAGNFSITVIDSNDCLASTTYAYTPVGIEVQSDFGVVCYPNPVVDWLTVELGNLSATACTVYDASGRILVRHEQPSTTQLRIDFTGFRQGVYLLEVEAGNARYRKILLH
ncbi:MAG: FG-GAP-like repeat-containing protein [Flavobacteriales bacterium]